MPPNMPPIKESNFQSYQHESIKNKEEEPSNEEPSNEYVLGIAFWTFVIFMITEAIFAIIAGSQAMLEDAEAMSVDALTYLFNLWAEKVKNRPLSEEEKRLPPEIREYRRERLRLYLEIIPPLISVVTLIIVTIFAMKSALETLGDEASDDDDVDLTIMLIFTVANLVLDFVNVHYFARAHQAFGLSTVKKEPSAKSSIRNVHNVEMESLISNGSADINGQSDDLDENDSAGFTINLNMCSAWTHICADTMRTIAVLVAVFIALLFPEAVSSAAADSWAAIVVSVIILVSLLPLLHGLYVTTRKLIALQAEAPSLTV